MPTEGNAGTGGWALDDAGTLYIRGAMTSTRGFALIDCYWLEGAEGAGAWGPFRHQVNRICMDASVRTPRMDNWFYGMDQLEDASGVFVPVGATSLRGLFARCSLLTALPEGFSLPDSLENAVGMLDGCTSLLTLPSSFAFTEKMNLSDVSNLLSNCTSLFALPEGFSVPAGVGAMDEMFMNCPSLTTLPQGFSLPAQASAASNLFLVTRAAGEPRLATKYPGSDPTVLNFDWASQNRTLVTDAGDRNLFEVTYQVANDDGSWATRTKALTDSDGFVRDLAVQNGAYSFTGWCEDPDCLVPFDFSKPVDQATTLYGKWIVHGGRNTAEGTLPVEPGTGEAWWQIASDGTLMLMGDGMVTKLWAYNVDISQFSSDYWGLHRGEVTGIAMQPGFKTRNMECWFAYMPKLVAADGVFIPEGCTTVHCLFMRSENLKRVSDDLRVPGTVGTVSSMFNNCKSLERVPEGLTIPYGATGCWWMFANCENLTELPSSFTVPDKCPNVNLIWKHIIRKHMKNFRQQYSSEEGKIWSL